MLPRIPVYWLCTTPRSGSSALSDALARTGVAGTPTEYFNSRFWPDLFGRFSVQTDQDYFHALFQRTVTPNGVFGAKVMLDEDMQPTFQALRELYSVPDLSDPETVRHAFPEIKLVFLTRRDKVLQAVSYCRAQQSGVWNRYNQQAHETSSRERYDFAEIHTKVQNLVRLEARWQTFFDAFPSPPYTLVYEDYVREPEASVRRIATFLDLELPKAWALPQLTTEKLGDSVSASWAERYLLDERG